MKQETNKLQRKLIKSNGGFQKRSMKLINPQLDGGRKSLREETSYQYQK